ncbi:MAG TPA: hypothetical protein VFF16_14340, partial [Telluria sp.]|nr:hypothetical protein [Telluria sp.]
HFDYPLRLFKSIPVNILDSAEIEFSQIIQNLNQYLFSEAKDIKHQGIKEDNNIVSGKLLR